tara:strand:+ start:746 stop:982 length:237 start_codon:yes stop_codon:yes gene_type:complete
MKIFTIESQVTDFRTYAVEAETIDEAFALANYQHALNMGLQPSKCNITGHIKGIESDFNISAHCVEVDDERPPGKESI